MAEFPEGFVPTKRQVKTKARDAHGLMEYIDVPVEPIDTAMMKFLSDNKDFFVQSSVSSKRWESARSSINALVDGSFATRYRWDTKFVSRIGGMDALSKKYDSFRDVMARMDSIVSVCRRRLGTGLWFPKVANHKIVKTTICDFLASYMRDGSYWSPFIELDRHDLCTIEDLMGMIGPQVREYAKEILKDVWWAKTYDSLATYWRGVGEYYKWVVDNARELDLLPNGNLAFGSILRALSDVKECNRTTKCVSPYFLTPRCRKWADYVVWLKENRHVDISKVGGVDG